MTQPGGISIDITADAAGFDAELAAAVKDALKDVQKMLDANPLNIKFKAVTTGLAADINRKLASMRLNQVKVEVNGDTSRFARQVNTDLAAVSLDPVEVEVNGDTSGFAQQVNAALAATNLSDVTVKVDLEVNATAAQLATLRQIQELADKTVKVKVDVDMSEDELKRLRQLASSMRQIKDLTDKSIKVKIDVDMSEAELKRLKEIGPALRSIRTLTDKNIKVKVNLDMTEDELKRLKEIGPALRAIRTLTDKDIRLKVRLDMSEAEVERLKTLTPALRSIRGLSDKDIKIKIDLQVDDARLMRLAALLREIRSRSVNVRVDTDADGAAAKVARLAGGLTDIGKLGYIASSAAAKLAVIGGAAGAAAGLVGGLVAAIGAIGPAAAAIGGTLAVGMQGVMDSFKAFGAVTDSASDDAEARSKAVAAASKQVESAERSLASAQKAAKAAQEDVTRARKEATDQLEDLKFANADAALAEKEAARALEKARKDLASAKTSDDRKDAALAVERAELSLAEAQERNRDQQEKSREMEEKGIENSDLVVAAKEKQAAADEELTAAQTALAEAQAEVTKAQGEQSDSVKKLNQELAKLAPSAREFVVAAHDLGDEWKAVRQATQESLFAGLGPTLTNVADQILPRLQAGMQGVAGQMNLMAKDFLNFAGSAQGLSAIDTVFTNTTALLTGLRQGTGEFTQGLIDLASAATPHMQALGTAIAGIGASIGQVFTAARENGSLDQIFGSLPEMLGGIGDLLNGALSGLMTMAAQVVPVLGPFFTELGNAIRTVAPSLGELGRVFIETLTPIIPQIADLVKAFAEGLKPVLPVIGQLIAAIIPAITPLVDPLSQVATVLGGALAQAITALQPAIGPLANAFASIITALAPIIPVVADFISMLVQALAPAVTVIFQALAPVIKQLAEQLKPVFEQMMPIIAETAGIIALALADAIKQLAPILPPLVTAFTNLLMAILPLLPEFAKMAADLLPPLVNVLIQITPQVIKLIDAFTWLVKNVLIPLVIPAIQQTKDNLVTSFEFIGNAIEWMRDRAKAAIEFILARWEGLKDGVSAVKDWFTIDLPGYFETAMDKIGSLIQRGVDNAKKIFDGMKEAAAVPIRFVVNTVWNDGLRRAWNSITKFLPGLDELEPVTLGFAKGGGVSGPGSGTSDDILAWLSNGEHVLTAREVASAGGQNVVYAIRDMLARGVPFEWNNGQVVQTLGRDNLAAYGAQVAQRGIGNVPPEGLFDPLLKFAQGGAIEPWMYQLQRGHDFAKAQNGRPYQWAGPRWVGDSFDCCLIAGSMVYGPDGACPISEVRPGFRVWSFENGKRTVRTVTAQWFSKRQGTYRVRTRNKSIVGSGNHPFMRLAKVSKWAPVKGGQRGEVFSDHWDVEWSRLDELQRGDLLIVPKDMSVEPKPAPQFAGQEVDVDIAWMIGLFIGDGHATSRDVKVCVYGDLRDRAERILARLGASSTGHGESYGLFAYSPTLAAEFDRLNQGRKSFEKRIPDEVWAWPAELQRAFLAGYCDADGHNPFDAARHGERTYASSSRRLVEDVRALHMILGDAVSNVSTNHRTKPITINGALVKNARPLHTFAVWSGRKGDGVAGRLRDNRGLAAWVSSGDFTIAPVLAIEDQGEQDTYDIEVEGAHNFVADGVIVHNSGFMGSIIAAILGGNPWARYWATSSFAGYPSVGAQGLVKNLRDGSGMAVGITDDPGGPGGGHTAGELRGIPELGYPAARVESGGAIGDVHYGRGTNPASFASLYGLPIGANGFFQPSPGGDSVGPSRDDQLSFVQRRIKSILDTAFDPLRAQVSSAVGDPPPLWRKIPPAAITLTEDTVVTALSSMADGLGDLLPGAWTKAQELGSRVIDAITPFDTGGIANGVGIMAKNTIEPERVLSPEQTRLFEALVAALQSISTSGPTAASSIVDAIGSSVGSAVSDAISALTPDSSSKTEDDSTTLDAQFVAQQKEQVDQTGQLISDTQALAVRTSSSVEQVIAEELQQVQAQVAEVANKLTDTVIGPVMQSAVTAALGVVNDAITSATKSITTAQNATTTAVKSISDSSTSTGLENFGQPGSAFDAADAISDAVVSVANTASSALLQLGQDIAKAALQQKPSRTDRSRGLLGDENNSGGPVADMIVQLTGVEIEIKDLIETLSEDIRKTRGEEFRGFDENGQLISDTAALVERTASSMELVVAEQNRINRALIKALLRYIVLNVILPIMTAILTALITVVTTAIGAAIGSLIPVIGTAVGAAIGALVGTALSAAAAAAIAAVGVGAGAAIDSFDSGGVAAGLGVMQKDTIEPERVLSPRQTVAFEELVAMLGNGGGQLGGSRTVQIGSVNVHGREPAKKTSDDLLALLAG